MFIANKRQHLKSYFTISQVFALAYCGTVFGLESANVVGYQNKEVRQNLSVQLPTFENIANEGIDIQSIIPVAAEGDELESGDFVIQIYDDTGAQTASYAWVLGADIDDGYADGWYEEDWETIVEKTFDVGEAFNVSASKGGFFRYSGQIVGEKISVPVRQNLSAQGNFRATEVDIQNIIPVAAEGDELESGDFVIQIYDDTGAQTASYAWVLGADIDDGYADGWYEEDWETLVEKTFAPGEGFNVSASKGGTLEFAALSL